MQILHMVLLLCGVMIMCVYIFNESILVLVNLGALMAGSVNKVILIGNLGRDPEIRQMQDGNPVVNLSVATSESWRDKATGERRDKTEWHRVVVFNEHLANIAEKFLKKGTRVYVEGQLQTRKWTDQTGIEKYSTEVILNRFRGDIQMLDRGAETTDGRQITETDNSESASLTDSSPNTSNPNTLDDDIPF